MAESGVSEKFGAACRATLGMPTGFTDVDGVRVTLQDYDFEKDTVTFVLQVLKSTTQMGIADVYQRLLVWWMGLGVADGITKQDACIWKEGKQPLTPWYTYHAADLDDTVHHTTLAVFALFHANQLTTNRRRDHNLIVCVRPC
jgi:hypothetical protein